MYSPFLGDGFENHDVEGGEDHDGSELGGDQGMDAVEQCVVPEHHHKVRASSGKGTNHPPYKRRVPPVRGYIVLHLGINN